MRSLDFARDDAIGISLLTIFWNDNRDDTLGHLLAGLGTYPEITKEGYATHYSADVLVDIISHIEDHDDDMLRVMLK
mgnify:FL=1